MPFLHLNIPEDTHRWLHVLAKEEGRSLTKFALRHFDMLVEPMRKSEAEAERVLASLVPLREQVAVWVGTYIEEWPPMSAAAQETAVFIEQPFRARGGVLHIYSPALAEHIRQRHQGIRRDSLELSLDSLGWETAVFKGVNPDPHGLEADKDTRPKKRKRLESEFPVVHRTYWYHDGLAF